MLSDKLSRRGGGVQSAMLGLSRALVQKGHDVHAFGLDDASLPNDRIGWQPVTLHVARSCGPAAFGFSPGLVQRLTATEPDVLHQHGLWTHASIAAIRWGRANHARRVVSPHNMLDPWALAIGSARKRLALSLYERRNLSSSGCLHALVPAEARAMRSLGIDNPIVVIPNGIDVDMTRETDTESQATICGDKRLPESLLQAPFLLYLGRVHAIKNLDALIDSWCSLDRRTTQPWRMVIAGWGTTAAEAHLRERVARADRADLAYLGAVFGDTKRTLFEAASGFVLPSLGEGQPMAALEAMAQGCPALLTEACNLPEATLAGAARTIHPDTDRLARDLGSYLQTSQTERDVMSRAARRLVSDRFSWHRSAHQFDQVYRWLLDGGDLPDTIDA